MSQAKKAALTAAKKDGLIAWGTSIAQAVQDGRMCNQPGCSKLQRPGAKFCTECGQQLQTVAAVVETLAPATAVTPRGNLDDLEERMAAPRKAKAKAIIACATCGILCEKRTWNCTKCVTCSKAAQAAFMAKRRAWKEQASRMTGGINA
jgi:hypothetical protein